MDYQVYPDANFGEFSEYAAIDTAFGTMLGLFIVIYAVAFLIGIAMYVMNGIALLRMAKKTGIRHGWLGFIPIGDIYLIGRISDAGKEKHTRTKMLMVTLIIFFALYIAFIAVLIGTIVAAPMADEIPEMLIAPLLISSLLILAASICLCIFEYIAFYHICDNFGGNSGVSYFVGLLLGSFFMPIVCSVLLLILSGKLPKVTEAPAAIPAAIEEKTDSVF